jgi:hypothetical protein
VSIPHHLYLVVALVTVFVELSERLVSLCGFLPIRACGHPVALASMEEGAQDRLDSAGYMPTGGSQWRRSNIPST